MRLTLTPHSGLLIAVIDWKYRSDFQHGAFKLTIYRKNSVIYNFSHGSRKQLKCCSLVEKSPSIHHHLVRLDITFQWCTHCSGAKILSEQKSPRTQNCRKLWLPVTNIPAFDLFSFPSRSSSYKHWRLFGTVFLSDYFHLLFPSSAWDDLEISTLNAYIIKSTSPLSFSSNYYFSIPVDCGSGLC